MYERIAVDRTTLRDISMHEVIHITYLALHKAVYNGTKRIYALKCPKMRDIDHKMLFTHGRGIIDTQKIDKYTITY